MPMEQETISMLISGFSIVMGITVIITIFLWMKNKRQSGAYIWLFLHFSLFSVAVYFSLQAISFDYHHPMASEEISLRLGGTGIFWALSMISLLLGIFNFSKSIKKV